VIDDALTEHLNNIWWIVAIAVIVFLIPLVRSLFSKKDNSELIKKHGCRTIAEIVDITTLGSDSHSAIDVELSLAFSTKDNQRLTAKAHTWVDVRKIALFQPGRQVPVKYMTKNPRVLAIDLPSSF
jgi:hypothetical protein